MLKFKELLELPKSGLFAFINEIDRKVDVYHTSNFLNAIERHITQIRLVCHPVQGLISDKNKIEIQWLEDVTDPHICKLKQSHWVRYFEGIGYTSYRKRTALEYTVKIRELHGLLRVVLENRNYDSIVVGIFDSKEACDIFVQKYYSDPNFLITYSDNELTKAYLDR